MYYHLYLPELDEENPYTVGHYSPQGKFMEACRFKKEEDASRYVMKLNSKEQIVVVSDSQDNGIDYHFGFL